MTYRFIKALFIKKPPAFRPQSKHLHPLTHILVVLLQICTYYTI
ncbi:hypothetical protein FTV88_1988 [Heliorestis convoluta]|uniref:Uncharacterized protein n=1 Tax=Heliorestis convoluta TaxID=356322 RepID=A0A5Q2N3B3_9FIRM|nr:hypothetical protein FTV88_1988 [Heliorestis convoluta]